MYVEKLSTKVCMTREDGWSMKESFVRKSKNVVKITHFKAKHVWTDEAQCNSIAC